MKLFIFGIIIGIALGVVCILIFDSRFTEGVLEVDNINRKWKLIITIPEDDIVKYSTIKIKVVNKCKDA